MCDIPFTRNVVERKSIYVEFNDLGHVYLDVCIGRPMYMCLFSLYIQSSTALL